MATAEVDSRPQEPTKRKPFANFVRKLVFKGGNQQEKGSNSKKANGTPKHKKNNTWGRNTNPYPQSGHLRQPQASQPSFGESSRQQYSSSYSSLPVSATQDRDGPSHSNKSGAPTLATNPETIHSDAGNSRAATTTTGAGGLSSVDGAGGGSTFSSPNNSDHSLATTLTTIQSTSINPGANGASGHHNPHNDQTQPMGSAFSHQYPVSPSMQVTTPASAIPRHLHGDTNQPNTYNSATAGNLLTDNASILTLASSSKRRRRSMDTDASVRALAPSSVFGGSRESLPLSVLSSNIDPPRHSVTGPASASVERASVYSSSGLIKENVGSPALGSERNSYYKQTGDAKSLRSISNLKKENTASADTASITGIYPRSEYDARSLNAGDVASLRSVEASGGHARNGSIPGSIGAPSLLRHTSTGGNTALSLSRRSSDWRMDHEEDETAVDPSVHDAEGAKEG